MGNRPGEPPRLRVGVLGAGRVGSVLGAALGAAGHDVVAASGLSDASLARTRALLPGVPIVSVEDVVARADLVLVGVPDAALAGVVAGVAERGGWRKGQIVVHLSAAHGVGVLGPAVQQQVLPVALNPAMRFSGTRVDLERLPETTVAVTTPRAVRPVGEALVLELGAEPVWVDESQRATYAVALAHAVDYTSIVVEQSVDLLAAAGVPNGRRMLATHMLTALEEALRSGCHVGAHVDDADALRDTLDTLDSVSPGARTVHLAVARAHAARAHAHGCLTTGDLVRLLDVLGTGSDAVPGWGGV